MKVYRLKPKLNSKGLVRISLVKEPAIEEGLMFFSEEKELIRFFNEEKQEIIAPVLIPNKLIFRKDINGEPAKVFFTEEDIKELHILGSKNGYDKSVNLEHQEMDTDGVVCFESWLIEDPRNDKAYHFGMEYPKGTLMKSYKIENKEIFDKIKSKELTGLSIEAFTNELEHIETNEKQQTKTTIKMNKQSIFSHIKSLFMANESKEYASGYFGTSLDESAIITDADGEPQANSEFEFEGKKYLTDDMGAIKEIAEVEKEAPVEVEMQEEEPKEDWAKKVAELELENADLKAEITKLKEGVTKMQSEIIEAKKITPIVETKPFEQMTNLEKHRYNKSLYS